MAASSIVITAPCASKKQRRMAGISEQRDISPRPVIRRLATRQRPFEERRRCLDLDLDILVPSDEIPGAFLGSTRVLQLSVCQSSRSIVATKFGTLPPRNG
jgi:hypothetical protein